MTPGALFLLVCAPPLQPSHKTFKIKRVLGKKAKQNRPLPHWMRMRTGNTIRCVESVVQVCLEWFPDAPFVFVVTTCRYNAKRRHWRRTKLGI